MRAIALTLLLLLPLYSSGKKKEAYPKAEIMVSYNYHETFVRGSDGVAERDYAWEEFNRIVWCAQAAPAFASGMVDGYFDGDVPMEFWKLLALYICSNTLSSLPWAIPFGEGEVVAFFYISCLCCDVNYSIKIGE